MNWSRHYSVWWLRGVLRIFFSEMIQLEVEFIHSASECEYSKWINDASENVRIQLDRSDWSDGMYVDCSNFDLVREKLFEKIQNYRISSKARMQTIQICSSGGAPISLFIQRHVALKSSSTHRTNSSLYIVLSMDFSYTTHIQNKKRFTRIQNKLEKREWVSPSVATAQPKTKIHPT